MKNETIKTFTEITVEQAGEMLRDNGWKPVNGLAFKDGETSSWGTTGKDELTGIDLDECDVQFFVEGNAYVHCATVTEINPCQAPDGCPDLEPWMAYVGKRELTGAESQATFHSYLGNGTWCEPAGPFGDYHRVIDVRDAESQVQFKEHCRIRNYKEPDAFEEFCAGWCLDQLQSAGGNTVRQIAKQAYELGQANPQPTK